MDHKIKRITLKLDRSFYLGDNSYKEPMIEFHRNYHNTRKYELTPKRMKRVRKFLDKRMPTIFYMFDGSLSLEYLVRDLVLVLKKVVNILWYIFVTAYLIYIIKYLITNL